MSEEKLARFHGPSLEVEFMGHQLVLTKFLDSYKITQPIRSKGRVNDPTSRTVDLAQGGSLNHWRAQFSINSASRSLLCVEGWAETPHKAIDLMTKNVKALSDLVGWAMG